MLKNRTAAFEAMNKISHRATPHVAQLTMPHAFGEIHPDDEI